MPIGKQISFVTSYDAAESRRELSAIGRMIKEDPLSPVSWYFRNAILPGAGLGLEGYVLFSIGNIKPLFQAKGSYTDCWKGKTCDQQWIYAIDYLEIVGIIFGQVSVGILGKLSLSLAKFALCSDVRLTVCR